MSRSNYYDMRDAKVRIAHELMRLGWKVYGYKEDQSDSMTDYYSPANWDGIATKNGFVLVVDCPKNYNSGKEITRYNPAGHLSAEDREKIAKLEAMTQANGSTASEEENAKAAIEKIKAKIKDQPAWEVVDRYPEFMPNPGKCKWHIEKDGKIYDKGTGITKYANMPKEWEFDIVKMEYKPGYDRWWNGEKKHITEETRKLINDFKNLILRFERVVNSMNAMGDGTKETELAGLEQQEKAGYEKVTVTETKTVTKPVEVTDRKIIQKGDILTFKFQHGGYWLVTDIWQNSKGVNCYTYEQLGSEKRGFQRLKNPKRYYQTEKSLLAGIENGNIKIHTMQTVTETKEVEKWVKINKAKTQTANNSNLTANQENFTYDYTITADVDTRDNSPLWVVKITDKLSKEEYIKVAEHFKALKGYYSKYKHGFIFRYDPTEALKGDNSNTITEQTEEQKQAERETEKTSLLEKINNNIESLEAKINSLSGEYKVNTYRRMKQQENRDAKINSWKTDIKILEYVKEKLLNNEPLTALEKGLIVGAFRDTIHQYYIQKYGKYPQTIEFPDYNREWGMDNWWNQEVPKRQNRLIKYGITNTAELNQAVDEYKVIYNSISRYISPKEQQIKKLTNEYKLMQKGDINFTPVKIAEQMIQYAKINNNSRVLEPSAGIGNIADKIKEITEHVDCIEYNYNFCELLKLKGHNVVANNFLEYNRQGYYDAIIMNPPFSNNQDITHLKHAYNLVKPGGIVVCITSLHWTFAKDKTSQNFREWIEEKDYFLRELPSGTFEMTGVRSQIVVIKKKEEIMQKAV